MKRGARIARGFTMVEMIIVIAIIAILALLAIVSYRLLVMKARTMEAYLNLGNLYVAEVVYKAENDTYRACAVYPRSDAELDGRKVLWGEGNADFSELGFSPQGSVCFNYRVSPVVSILSDFEAVASCDFDRDGRLGVFSLSSRGMSIVKLSDD